MAKYWQRFKDYYYDNKELGLSIDTSRMNFPDNLFDLVEPQLQRAYREMTELEDGAIANPDENRMVGHYWLRNPALAPFEEITAAINNSIERISVFAKTVHQGMIGPGNEKRFKNFILIGIGGSALGPQLVSDALWTKNDYLKPYYIDNTDPDGIDRVLAKIGMELEETLIMVASKSGGTTETYNGMQEVRVAFAKQGITFTNNAVAITMPGSKLDLLAKEEGWLESFPLWDWVGGRTSVTSAVGLLPAALQGIDITSFLKGARSCDEQTRQPNTSVNPAAQLALMWFHATDGKGSKDMVILPYKDRLQHLACYMQQLVMESLGKKYDRNGVEVNQGISVYGNKGSTDQHAYVQQLIEGVNNFFVTFIEVLGDERKDNIYITGNITSGDYLQAFLLGTRQALTQQGRESLTITIKHLDAFSLGVLIALFERAIGIYASLININAYHQPGVELGKKGANMIIDMLAKSLDYLQQNSGETFSVEEIAAAIGNPEDEERLFKILEHLSANSNRGVKKICGIDPFKSRYTTI